MVSSRYALVGFVVDPNAHISLTLSHPAFYLAKHGCLSIQDHIVSAVLLTKKDSFYPRDVYMQFIYAACRSAAEGKRIETIPPAILKPKPLWTGKQVRCLAAARLVMVSDDGAFGGVR